MDSVTKKRGGPREGAGRKRIGDAPSVVVPIRMTQPQKEKLARIGGAEWVRRKIDKEKENGNE